MPAELSRSPCLPAAEQAQRATNAWLTGRSSNLADVKPGVRSIMLVFSSHDGQQVDLGVAGEGAACVTAGGTLCAPAATYPWPALHRTEP